MNDCMKGNILIACYSYSGKTRRIAEVIQKVTGGNLSQIYPRQPYPADFERLLIQVRMETGAGRLPPLLPVTENADRYDVIFAGSPNWCGTISPPLAAWLAQNDLTGKIPGNVLPARGVRIDDQRAVRRQLFGKQPEGMADVIDVFFHAAAHTEKYARQQQNCPDFSYFLHIAFLFFICV